MRRALAWLRRLGGVFTERGRSKDFVDELNTHLQLHIDQNIRAGMTPDEARREARLALGGIEQTKEVYRERQHLLVLDTVIRDLGYAIRQLIKHPSFALTTIATLAVCIGVNTAMYSVIQAVLLRPLPYPQPERLAELTTIYGMQTAADDVSSYDGAAWQVVRERVPALIWAADSDLSTGVNLVANHSVTHLRQHRVSADFFRVLGIQPFVGRNFILDEDRPNGDAVVVLSHGVWRRLFAEDPSVVGQKVLLRGEPHTIVGVMPPGFQTDIPADVWTSLRPTTEGEGSGQNYRIIARLRPEATWAEAEAQVTAASDEALRHTRQTFPREMRLTLLPLQRELTASIRRPLVLLWTAVGLVLLIGCLNLAGLLIARAAVRRREIATRLALGASKARVVLQLLIESIFLAVCGAVVGIVVGVLVTRLLTVLAQDSLPIYSVVAVDSRVVLVMIGMTACTTIVYGLFPAWSAVRIDVRGALLEGGSRGVAGTSRRWSRRMLVIGEIAAGAVVLTAAGVVMRSFVRMSTQPPGFDAHHLVTATVSMQDARYTTSTQVNRLFDATIQAIQRVPGVEAVAVAMRLPYQRGMNMGFVRLDGPGAPTQVQLTTVSYVTSGYFDALRTPLRAGRTIVDTDRADSAPVAVVNETFARRYLTSQQPIGTHLGVAGPNREVIGIVADVPQEGTAFGAGPLAVVPAVFIPAAQASDVLMRLGHTWWSPQWIVRTGLDQQALTPLMQQALASIDPNLVFAGFQSVDRLEGLALAQPRVLTILLSVFASLALGLSMLGTYGLVANLVIERRRELGIRLALGATKVQAMRTAAMPGLALSGIGIVVGGTLAWLSKDLVRNVIWGVTATDRLSLASATSVLFMASVVATVIPTLTVLRLDPAQTLRDE